MTKEEAEAEFLAQSTKLEQLKQSREAEFHKELVQRLLDDPESITAEELVKLCVGIPKQDQENYQRYWAEHNVRAIQKKVEREDVIREFDSLLAPLGIFVDRAKLADFDAKTMTSDEVQTALGMKKRTVYDSDGGVEHHDYDCRCGNCEADP